MCAKILSATLTATRELSIACHNFRSGGGGLLTMCGRVPASSSELLQTRTEWHIFEYYGEMA